jgi:hypothetical protein
LIEYFPQAILAFSDITQKTALQFLEKFPTFESAQGQTDEEWKAFLDEQRCFHPKARQRFFDAMKLPPIKIDDAVVKAKSLFVTTIVGQLSVVITSLAEYQKQIEILLRTFDDGFLFRSLPGVDVILAAKLLISIGTDRERFSKASELQSFFGTAPYTKGSGQYRCVHFRLVCALCSPDIQLETALTSTRHKACHKGMRAACKHLALASLRSSAWAKSYFARKRKEGKRAHHALRCLANLWLKVIFAMFCALCSSKHQLIEACMSTTHKHIWKTKTVYDETLHLASIFLFF